ANGSAIIIDSAIATNQVKIVNNTLTALKADNIYGPTVPPGVIVAGATGIVNSNISSNFIDARNLPTMYGLLERSTTSSMIVENVTIDGNTILSQCYGIEMRQNGGGAQTYK